VEHAAGRATRRRWRILLRALARTAYFGHGLSILTGRYDREAGSLGDISHFKALATALAAELNDS
jgi:hypothetical protein